jgi:hypothetical protein
LVHPEATLAGALILLPPRAPRLASFWIISSAGKSRGTVKNTLLSSDLESKHRPTDHSKKPLSKAVAFAAGLGLCMFSCPVHAAPTSTGDTVRGLYDALLSTMKKGRTLGQSGRFTRLEPVIRRSFDIAH